MFDFLRLGVINAYLLGCISYVWGYKSISSGVRFLTFRGYKSLRSGVRLRFGVRFLILSGIVFLTFGRYKSLLSGLDFLRSRVINP